MSDANATCLTCRFCDAGQCHRNPPQMVPWPNDNQHPVLYEPMASWPFVSGTDWCGEHKPVAWGSVRGQKP